MNFTIQSSVFPSHDLCSEESLYFRLNDRCMLQYGEVNRILMSKDGRLNTDTYFNSISIGKWKNHTGLTDLTLKLHFKGKVVLKWWWHRTQYRHLVIGETTLESADAAQARQVQVPQYDRLTDGVINFELFALEDSELTGFEYATVMQPRRDVKLGIAITHFNRQQYVIPAVRRLNEQLLTDPRYVDRVKLFVVDNSQNLQPEEMTGATIIPNANLGGSGGFMRGLIHLQDCGDFTHCLFMDDDASNEIDAIRRTISLLQYAIDENTAVTGAMFYEQVPYLQHENGAWFNGVCFPRNSGLDMRHVHCIVDNEIEEAVDYGGWWFFAFALKSVKEYVFPFFVRGDDTTFSIKNNFKIMTLNGICSWQEDFRMKDSPLTAYLDVRSNLAQSLIGLNPKASRGKALRLIRNGFKKYAWTYHYESAQALLDGLEDVMKGPLFWMENVDMKERRPQIMSRINKEKMQPLLPDWRQKFHWVDKPQKKRLSRRLTLNGHLLPLFVFRKHNVSIPKGYGGRINESFRCKKVLCVDLLSQKGYAVEHDKQAFFSGLLRYYRLRYRFWRDYNKLKLDYQSQLKNLTSREFWKNQFETHNK